VPDTYLVDIRTQAEYQFVGHPFKAYNYPYLFFTTTFAKDDEKPSYQLTKNKVFLEQIGKVFKKTDNLLLLTGTEPEAHRRQKSSSPPVTKTFSMCTMVLRAVNSLPLTIPTSTSTTGSLPNETTFTVLSIAAIQDGNFWGLPWTYDMESQVRVSARLGSPAEMR